MTSPLGFHPHSNLPNECYWFSMSKSYVIHWKSKVNGRAGRGTTLFEREEAERLAVELNQDYPEIEHEVRENAAANDAGGLLVVMNGGASS